MASSDETPKSFEVLADSLNIWVNKFESKIRVHFRQVSDDENKPRKNYIFMDGSIICKLLCCCGRTGQPDFDSEIVDEHDWNGKKYVVELVKKRDENDNSVYSLQTRGTKYSKPMRTIKITDWEQFKEVLCDANIAYRVMYYEEVCDELKRKRETAKAEESPKKLKIADPLLSYEDELTRAGFPEAYLPRDPRRH